MNKKASISALISASIVGFSFLFVKNALHFSTPIDLLAHRFTLAFITLLIYMLVTKTTINFTWENLKKVSLVAFFYPVLYFTLQTYGLLSVPSSQAGTIQAIVPVLTLIISSFILKEKSTGTQKIGIIFSVSGVIFLQIINASGAEKGQFLGILIIIASVIAMSISQVLSKKSTRKISYFDISFFSILMGFIGFNLLATIQHVSDQNWSTFFEPLGNSQYVLSLLYLGTLSSFGTILLNLYSLSTLSTIKVSVFGNFATLVSILAGLFFLHESFGISHLLGSLMIITGVFLVNNSSSVQRTKT